MLIGFPPFECRAGAGCLLNITFNPSGTADSPLRTTEDHFEWLGDGSDTLIPPLRSFLTLGSRSPVQCAPPRLLHIGAGSSALAERVRETYRDVYGDSMDESVIVNLDFSKTAVERGIEKEMTRIREGAGRGMSWVHADVLRWKDMAKLAEHDAGGKGGQICRPFVVVLDKSTSDAISCGDDVSFTGAASSNCHLLVRRVIQDRDREILRVHPVELLAIHLASLVDPGGLWISLSFSSERFSFLRPPHRDKARESPGTSAARLTPASYWDIEHVQAVNAPSGLDKHTNVHAPAIYHYVYVLRRTAAPVDELPERV